MMKFATIETVILYLFGITFAIFGSILSVLGAPVTGGLIWLAAVTIFVMIYLLDKINKLEVKITESVEK